MASITIRRLDEDVKTKLQMRAALHGRSMEEEAREILRAGVETKVPPRRDLAAAIRAYIEPIGGVDLELPERQAVRPAPDLNR